MKIFRELANRMRKLSSPRSSTKSEAGDEEGGSQAGDVVVRSPLSSVAGLLRLYCYLGVIAGRLSRDCCSLSTRWWLHLKTAAVVAALYTLSSFVQRSIRNTIWAAQHRNWVDDTKTDLVVDRLRFYLVIVCLLATLFTNHRSFSQLYRVTTLLSPCADDGGGGGAVDGAVDGDVCGDVFGDPKPILRHHAVSVFLYAATSVAEYADLYLVGLDNNPFSAKKRAGWFLTSWTVDFSLCLYLVAVVAVPELVIGRLVQSCASVLSLSATALDGRRMDAAAFVRRVDTVRDAYAALGKVFGRSMFLLVLATLMLTIVEAYSVVSILFRGPTFNALSDGLSALQHGAVLLVCAKRLMHLTGLVHDFHKRVDDARDRLIDHEIDPTSPHHRAATKSQRLLSRLDGLNVHGFFLVDRRIFSSLVGFFLTYLVLLIEFRVSDADDESKKDH